MTVIIITLDTSQLPIVLLQDSDPITMSALDTFKRRLNQYSCCVPIRNRVIEASTMCSHRRCQQILIAWLLWRSRLPNQRCFHKVHAARSFYSEMCATILFLVSKIRENVYFSEEYSYLYILSTVCRSQHINKWESHYLCTWCTVQYFIPLVENTARQTHRALLIGTGHRTK
jgi:hypothetical protein